MLFSAAVAHNSMSPVFLDYNFILHLMHVGVTCHFGKMEPYHIGQIFMLRTTSDATKKSANWNKYDVASSRIPAAYRSVCFWSHILGAAQYNCCPLLLPTEQLHWREGLNAFLNGISVAVVKGGQSINHSFPLHPDFASLSEDLNWQPFGHRCTWVY